MLILGSISFQKRGILWKSFFSTDLIFPSTSVLKIERFSSNLIQPLSKPNICSSRNILKKTWEIFLYHKDGSRFLFYYFRNFWLLKRLPFIQIKVRWNYAFRKLLGKYYLYINLMCEFLYFNFNCYSFMISVFGVLCVWS